MTKAVNELGLEWSPPEEPSRSRLDDCFFYRGAIRLSANARPSSSPKCTTSSRNLGARPIRLASAPLLQPLSLPLKVLKRKDGCRLSDGRRGRHIHPSRAELHLHSLDAPTQQLDRLLQRCTRWLCFRFSKQDARQ